MDCSMPSFPVHHQLLELAQTRGHWIGDAIQPSHPLSSPSPPAFSLSSGSFSISQFFASRGQSIGASASVLPMYIQHGFPLGLTHLEKRPWCWKDWRQEEKGMTEDEMVGWHHRHNGHEFEQAPGVGDGQGSLACCSHGVTKSQTWLSDWTEQKNLVGYSFIKSKEK